MSEPIVVGTDGSQSAERAVERAGHLALALGSTVHIVNSYSANSNGAWMAAAAGVPAHLPDDERQKHAEEIVLRARQQLESAGVVTQTHVCRGEPAEALIAIAEGEGAQMIVVGNRGMSGPRRVLGSVPNSVSHHARCAVVIVPTC
jgi:nucleotide-binding universal stress UspA family protein